MAFRSYIYMHLLFAALLHSAYSQGNRDNDDLITIKPKDTVGEIGQKVTLECEADWNFHSDQLEWRYYPAGGTGQRIWSSSEGVKFPDLFEVSREGYLTRMTIKSLQEDLAVLYVCKLLVKDAQAKAQIVTLSGFGCLPTWDPPPMTPNPPKVIQDEEMRFSCSVHHTGAMSPKLAWYRKDTDTVITTSSIDDPETKTLTATANVTAKAELDEVVYECRLFFEDAGGVSKAEYTDQCETYYQVDHAATNIRTYPESDGQVINIDIGSFINCSADGRPEPTYYWYDKDTMETVNGQILDITEDLAGEHTWVCRADNVVMGNPRFTEREVTFLAIAGVTQSPVKASTKTWVIIVAVIVPVVFIALIIFLVLFFLKKRKAGPKPEKEALPPGDNATQDPQAKQPLMQQQPGGPVPKPRSTPSVASQDSGVEATTPYRPGSQGQIYRPKSQEGHLNRQQPPQGYQQPPPGHHQPPPGQQGQYYPPRQGSMERLDPRSPAYNNNPQMMYNSPQGYNNSPGGPGGPGPQQPHMYRRPSQEQLDPRQPQQQQLQQGAPPPNSNLQVMRRKGGSRDGLDQSPRQEGRRGSRDRLNSAPGYPSPGGPGQPQIYRPPSQDRLDDSGSTPQPLPRTKLSKSKENLAQPAGDRGDSPAPAARPRGKSFDLAQGGSPSNPGLAGAGAGLGVGGINNRSRENIAEAVRRSRENLAGDGGDSRPSTLPKPSRSREDLSTDPGAPSHSGPPTAPKPKNMQQRIGVQVLPPPPQRQQSSDTQV